MGGERRITVSNEKFSSMEKKTKLRFPLLLDLQGEREFNHQLSEKDIGGVPEKAREEASLSSDTGEEKGGDHSCLGPKPGWKRKGILSVKYSKKG